MPLPKDTNWLHGNKNKTHIYIYCLQETYFRPRDTCSLKVRGWKNIFHANGNQKKAEVAIFILDKKYCYKIQGRVLYNDQGVNPRRRYNSFKYIICTKHRNTQYIRRIPKAIEEKVNSNTIIMGNFNFNTTLTPMNTSSR